MNYQSIMKQLILEPVINYSEIITKAIPFLSDIWKEENGAFLNEEYIDEFCKGLISFNENQLVDSARKPEFKEEITPPISTVFQYFKKVINLSTDCKPDEEPVLAKAWAEAIEQTPFENILLLMGQRFTSASVKDLSALPPLRRVILESSLEPFNDQICVATRAWEKHMGRSNDAFWGIMKGNPTEKDDKVRKLIRNMIDSKTWWNVFFHYKHELVYEIRVPSGHGIRWNRSGTQLIGFLEPFL